MLLKDLPWLLVRAVLGSFRTVCTYCRRAVANAQSHTTHLSSKPFIFEIVTITTTVTITLHLAGNCRHGAERLLGICPPHWVHHWRTALHTFQGEGCADDGARVYYCDGAGLCFLHLYCCLSGPSCGMHMSVLMCCASRMCDVCWLCCGVLCCWSYGVHAHLVCGRAGMRPAYIDNVMLTDNRAHTF